MYKNKVWITNEKILRQTANSSPDHKKIKKPLDAICKQPGNLA